ELGWELWVEPAWAITVWDRLSEAGRDHGIRACGYRVLDGLRLERGYRAWGAELTATDSPDDAGLSFCVDPSKAFVGREGLLAARKRGSPTTLRTLLIGDGYVTAYGGEAVHVRRRLGSPGTEVVGRLRSAAFGYSVDRMIGTAYVPPTMARGDRVEVEVFGELVPAEVAEDVLVDPEGKRVRS
ncbi:MAG TPA: glycine cleavage T C-terminal barrel domain-containing protein, partial [Actinomycetota bacterium]|nr:glycine cleavage T C-terminal barrel domain-containing protein [Actinomycetota bacterium]